MKHINMLKNEIVHYLLNIYGHEFTLNDQMIN